MPKIAVFPDDTEKDYNVIIDLKRALEEELHGDHENIILELKKLKEVEKAHGIEKELLEREIRENLRSNLDEKEYQIILRDKKALESDLRNNEENIIIELKRNLERNEQQLKEEQNSIEREIARINRNSFEYRFPSHSDKEEGFEFFFDTDKSKAELIERKMASKGLFFNKKSKVSDYLFSELLNDQLIQSDESNNIELSHKHLKINGDKQPKNIFNKYKKLYEKYSGLELNKGSKLKFDLEPEVEVDNIFEIRVR